MNKVLDWVKIYENFEKDGLKHKQFNKEWTKEERFRFIAQVLTGKSMHQVALDNGLECGQLSNWIKRYQEKGIDGLELRKGKKPKVPNT